MRSWWDRTVLVDNPHLTVRHAKDPIRDRGFGFTSAHPPGLQAAGTQRKSYPGLPAANVDEEKYNQLVDRNVILLTAN